MNKDHFLIELSGSELTMFGRVAFAEQPFEQKAFSAIWELEGQVNNGGFAQLFTNTDSEVVNFAPEAFRAIGAHKCADIVSRALRVISGIDMPADFEGRDKVIQALDQKALDDLDKLDEEFFTYPDNTSEMLFDYVKARPQVFGAVPGE